MNEATTISFSDRIDRDIFDERIRQIEKFGPQNHEPFKWLAILGEEVGECNNAAIEAFDWKAHKWGSSRVNGMQDLRTELVQVAAVAKAFIECIDRGTWR